MNLKKKLFFLLIVSVCLVNKNIEAAAEKKVIRLRSEFEDHVLPLEQDFVLIIRGARHSQGIERRSTFIRSSARCLQYIPAIGRDKETGAMYVRIPQGYQLSDKAASDLHEHRGQEAALEQREVPASDDWVCDGELRISL
jgi:hypothetical protein